MGCDYYIVKLLEVKYMDDGDDEHHITIELERERGYFPYEDDSKDSDDSSDDESITSRFNRKYGKYLDVSYKPMELFNEIKKWKNKKVEEKYDELIRNEINNGLLLSVIKKEVRYLR